MSATFHALTPTIKVIERGWLNCNQVLLTGPDENVLVDSGYGRHARQTLALLAGAEGFAGRPLHRLVNTHCHSDHMGGNAALRAAYACRITIPVDEVKHVVPWTAQSCWAEATGQYAEQFSFDDTITPGEWFDGGGVRWQAWAAPGHDMDALMFFCEETGMLVSGDALWHIDDGGMGFVWPMLAADGRNHFIDTALQTLDRIERLKVRTVIPGHGPPFNEVTATLDGLRQRLAALRADPAKNARHVMKALLVFTLLDRGSMPVGALGALLAEVPVYGQLNAAFLGLGDAALAERLLADLLRAGAVAVQDGVMRPTMRA